MSKTILCADDSATMQTVAEITFGSSDYEYVGARSADDAVKAAREKKPALILVDAVMPGKSGYDLCKEVKNDPALADVPVVMMCGNSQAYDEAKGSEAGVDAHVTKPWDTEKMITRVGELLEQFASNGVAASGSKAAAPAPTPPAVAPPVPSIAAMAASADSRAPSSDPARSMTIMGMPTLQMPPGGDEAEPMVPDIAPAPPKAPGLPPMEAKAPPPTPAPAPKPAAMERPPMTKAVPTKRISFAAYARKASPEELAAARAEAQRIAGEAGHNLSDTEASAILKLTKEVVERIVWEAVPDLAETIIRENLDKLTAR